MKRFKKNKKYSYFLIVIRLSFISRCSNIVVITYKKYRVQLQSWARDSTVATTWPCFPAKILSSFLHYDCHSLWLLCLDSEALHFFLFLLFTEALTLCHIVCCVVVVAKLNILSHAQLCEAVVTYYSFV